MFLSIFSEWVCFFFILFLSVFFFFDEEPFLDPTDWNIVHTFLILLCLLIVVWENIIKSRYGQFVYKDQVLVFSTFSFWFGIENYSRLIVIVFCFHCLTPLELELVELVEVYSNVLQWYTSQLLPVFVLLLIIFFLMTINNFFLNWQNIRFNLLLCFLVIIILSFSLLVILWEFLLSSMTGCLFFSNPQQFYTHSRSSVSYDMIYQGVDFFDWHISKPEAFVFRFEDLYLFFLQLFNITALYSCLIIFLVFFQDLLTSYTSCSLSSKSSITFCGIVTRWLDHALWCFVYSHLSILLVSLRLVFRVSFELGVWVF